jgi:hypothetical protein
MKWHDIFGRWLRRPRLARPPAPRRRGLRLSLEQLEDRTVPSAYTAASVTDLIADINAANLTPEADTITLDAGKTFTLTVVDNTTDGANGLPVIAATENLTIVGNGDTIERSTAAGTPAFRLFGVAAGATLTLNNLMLQGGWAWASGLGVYDGASARGGAIYNSGTLLLSGVTVQNNVAQDTFTHAEGGAIYNQGALTLQGVILQNNTAQGGNGNVPGGYSPGNAYGGALYSSGPLIVDSCTIQNNAAMGGHGGDGQYTPYYGTLLSGARGGNAYGGGLYLDGGSVTISDTMITLNTARGGDGGDKGLSTRGGNGGWGIGGGIYVSTSAVTVHNTSVTENVADGGAGGTGAKPKLDGKPGSSIGGGIYVVIYSNNTSAPVGLDAFTVKHVKLNHAAQDKDISGPYDVIA